MRKAIARVILRGYNDQDGLVIGQLIKGAFNILDPNKIYELDDTLQLRVVGDIQKEIKDSFGSDLSLIVGSDEDGCRFALTKQELPEIVEGEGDLEEVRDSIHARSEVSENLSKRYLPVSPRPKAIEDKFSEAFTKLERGNFNRVRELHKELMDEIGSDADLMRIDFLLKYKEASQK